MSLTASIVIATYRRPQDLAACLDSILGQSAPPLEVIVVDNDARRSAQATLCPYEAQYRAQRILLRYQASPKNSPSCARNLGVQLAQGDIVLFLDDDVVLEKDYLSEILKVYAACPTALGVQGYITNSYEGPRFWRKVFFQPDCTPDVCRVLPSIRSIYPLTPKTILPCEHLSGSNASYRHSILMEFPQDENLLKYSFGEDLDQSYRIFQRHPDTLWLTPFARCIHKNSPAGRATSQERVYMIEIYGLYLFYKLFPKTLKNVAIYWWSFLGRILGKIKHPSRATCVEVGHLLGAWILCMAHLHEIKAGNLEFSTAPFPGETCH
jgi:GT2 family glycosyltransferase